jgi:hypothetical protein
MPLRNGSERSSRRRRRRRRSGGRTVQQLEIARNVFSGAAILTQGIIGVSRLMNTEQKYIDRFSVYAPLNVLTNTSLGNIVQGVGQNQRIGNQIKIITVKVRYYIAINQDAQNTSVRLMLVADTQTNGVSFQPADLLANSAAQYNLVSPINVSEVYRFRILQDRLLHMSIDGQQVRSGTLYFSTPMLVRYNGGTAGVGAVTTNNIYLAIVSDEGVNAPVLTTYTRVVYVDN